MEYSPESFAVIGGDKRQLYCARSLCDDGYAVTLGGFDKVSFIKNIDVASPLDAVTQSDIIVLPLPSVDPKGRIPSPFSDQNIVLSDDLINAMKGKKVFCGFKNKLLKSAPSLDCELYDYYEREEFAVANAIVTAEGAIGIALDNFEGTINGARCLVCGYGRIGKALCKLLSGMGARLTVSARSPADIEWIKLFNAIPVRTDELYKQEGFDIIFSTVPAMILSGVLLAKIAMNAIVIDLASAEGSVDHYAAGRLGINTIHALSLPGKTAPKTAGEIVKNTIYQILEEDDR